MDALSFLNALDNLCIVDPLLQQLMVLCHALQDLGSFFTFVSKYLGSVCIEGNEEADAASRNAVDSPQSMRSPYNLTT